MFYLLTVMMTFDQRDVIRKCVYRCVGVLNIVAL